jgi:hypothetical protein
MARDDENYREERRNDCVTSTTQLSKDARDKEDAKPNALETLM